MTHGAHAHRPDHTSHRNTAATGSTPSRMRGNLNIKFTAGQNDDLWINATASHTVADIRQIIARYRPHSADYRLCHRWRDLEPDRWLSDYGVGDRDCIFVNKRGRGGSQAEQATLPYDDTDLQRHEQHTPTEDPTTAQAGLRTCAAGAQRTLLN